MSVREMRVSLGCRARREERSVASHTSNEQRRTAPKAAAAPVRSYANRSRSKNNMTITSQERPAAVTLTEAFWYWLKLGFISFGGPAGQIALMHTELVE